MRLSQLDVIEEDDDALNDKVYCVIHAESPNRAEVRLTTPTSALDEGDTHYYTLEDGIFWGIEAPADPGGSLVLTYDCFEQDEAGAWGALAASLAQALQELPGIVPNAWIAAAGAAASILQQALALDSDDHLLKAQQTLDPAQYVNSLAGVTWTVRKSGTNLNSAWDWRLHIQLWGCAEFGR